MTTVAADAAVLERTVGTDAIVVVVSGQTGCYPDRPLVRKLARSVTST
jgi:hypothetical protein